MTEELHGSCRDQPIKRHPAAAAPAPVSTIGEKRQHWQRPWPSPGQQTAEVGQKAALDDDKNMNEMILAHYTTPTLSPLLHYRERVWMMMNMMVMCYLLTHNICPYDQTGQHTSDKTVDRKRVMLAGTGNHPYQSHHHGKAPHHHHRHCILLQLVTVARHFVVSRCNNVK